MNGEFTIHLTSAIANISKQNLTPFENNRINELSSPLSPVSPTRRLRRTYNELINIVDEIFKKGIRNRTPKDTSDLNEFLELIKFSVNMKEEIEDGYLDLQQLIFFSSQFMNFQTFNKGDVIYYEGDTASNFYVLIKGNINLFKLNFESKYMNGYDYYKYLKYYKENYKNEFVLNKTINANENIFPVYDSSDIDNFDDILFKVKLVDLVYKENDKKKILNFLRNNDKNPEDYEFDQLESGELTMDEYFATLHNKLKETENNYFSNKIDETKKVKIMENVLIKSLTEKEYFGLFRLEEGGDIRRDTAICERDNTLLLVVNKKLYSGCISSDQIQVKENEIDKIYFGTIFTAVRRFNFEKHYFYNLDKIEYSKGEEIFNEGQRLDYIYILKRGTVEVNLYNKTIIDIKKLIQKFKDFDKAFLKQEFDDTLKLKNSLISMKNYIIQKKNYTLYVINSKETFGLWEYCYNNRNTLYSLKVKSDRAIFYKMNIDIFLEEIHDRIPDCELLKKRVKLDAFEQVKNNIERLIFLKNSVLMKKDFEFSKMKKDEEKDLENKLKVFDDKNLMKPINYKSNINSLLKVVSPQHSHTNSIDNLNPLKENNLRKFISHKPSKSYISIKTIENDLNEKYSKFITESNLNKKNGKFSNLGKIKREKLKNSLFNKKKNEIANEKVIFPKILSPNRIQSPSYLRLKDDMIKEKLQKRNKVRNQLNSKNDHFLTQSFNPTSDNNVNVNYLAIREFYNKFNSCMAKNVLNKSTK